MKVTPCKTIHSPPCWLCSMMVDSRHLEPVLELPHLLTTTGLAELVWDLKQEVVPSGQEVREPRWEEL